MHISSLGTKELDSITEWRLIKRSLPAANQGHYSNQNRSWLPNLSKLQKHDPIITGPIHRRWDVRGGKHYENANCGKDSAEQSGVGSKNVSDLLKNTVLSSASLFSRHKSPKNYTYKRIPDRITRGDDFKDTLARRFDQELDWTHFTVSHLTCLSSGGHFFAHFYFDAVYYVVVQSDRTRIKRAPCLASRASIRDMASVPLSCWWIYIYRWPKAAMDNTGRNWTLRFVVWRDATRPVKYCM